MVKRVYSVLTAAVLCLGLAACGPALAASAPPAESPSPSPETSKSTSPPPVRVTYPVHGHQKWTTAPIQTTQPVGRSGPLMRYRVEVEKDIKGVPAAAFAQAVGATLADPRGWTAGGHWRFQQVGPGRHPDFTIYLATPGTRDDLCDDVPDGYTSCRNGADVVLNVARWVKGVPFIGLPTYRQYMVNHEVGHKLGNGHQLCPAPGQPAPVMQQQTLGLHGCQPNPWPYPNGHRLYAGRSGQYGDHPPAPDKGLA
jgi:uncharacterized protein DUF3152